MACQPRLIVQLPRAGAVERQLSAQAPQSVASGEVVVEIGPTDAEGHLEPLAAGRLVLSVPSPEALERNADEVRRVIGRGSEHRVQLGTRARDVRRRGRCPGADIRSPVRA